MIPDDTMLPTTLTLPPIPTPPATTTAPDVQLVPGDPDAVFVAVVLVTTRLPATPTPPATANAPALGDPHVAPEVGDKTTDPDVPLMVTS